MLCKQIVIQQHIDNTTTTTTTTTSTATTTTTTTTLNDTSINSNNDSDDNTNNKHKVGMLCAGVVTFTMGKGSKGGDKFELDEKMITGLQWYIYIYIYTHICVSFLL